MEKIAREKRRKEEAESKRSKAIVEYKEMVEIVLDQLRQATYPGSALAFSSDILGTSWRIQHLEVWSDENYETKIDSIVELEFDSNDNPRGFCLRRGFMDETKTRTGLSREELLHGLMKLHPRKI